MAAEKRPKRPKRAKRREPAVPLYEKLKRQLSERILLGSWPPGTVIAGEQRLAQEFRMSVGTVRRALADMVQEGLLSRRRKTGTVVTGRTPQHSLQLFFQYFRLHGADGALQKSLVRDPSIRTLAADKSTAKALGIAMGANVVELCRTRVAAGRAVMRDRYVMAQARIPDFPLDARRVPRLLFRHLLERYGIRISAMREELRAEIATREDRRVLGLAAATAILAIDAVAFDQSGKPCALVFHRATTAHHRYVNEIQ